ncbi:bifunctional UDP-N-acetylglucosamine diphosphorylase/glucosamine-1-phosphate N-acetyltransferase GlmU [Desulfovibrio sp. OttesenSCG-928-F07]|nr:bifunctional UDP-N-acetylglucosamine diphosphorylase/glucosamine-1-phosphate N-acetyltransferase GlmU [Desulfovibrio sp. OttesenSCG-928-F07]
MSPFNKNYGAVVLAAGKGTRMHSALPKVLHTLLGTPMLKMVLNALVPAFEGRIWTIIGHEADTVQAQITENTRFVLQKEQLGTGHALMQAWPDIEKANIEYLLVVNGDTPLISTEKMQAFTEQSVNENADLSFLTLTLPDPAAFGRVVRKNGAVTAVIEAKDYNEQIYGPTPNEINAGIYLLKVKAIAPLLQKIGNNNKSNEYYITDLIALAVQNNLVVTGVNQGNSPELLGVNSPAELALAEEELRNRVVTYWQKQGVLIRAASSVRISAEAQIAPGAEITGPCEIYGTSTVESGVKIESHCWVNNTTISKGCHIRSFCHFEDATIAAGCKIGPYARLRPGATLHESAHVGNFVEIKKAILGKGAKANHLTYIGDAEIGAGTNIGAGTITCNYDGVNKHKTVIGEHAFIGSNTALVAPVEIGSNTLIGAGSVITRNVPNGELAVARARQTNLPRKKK